MEAFKEVRNSFFNTVFTLGERPDLVEPPADTLQNLNSISALYIYSNPPPMGYGTPAPKVAESVLRAYGMNKKPEGQKTVEIDGYHIVDPVWRGKAADFPWYEPASNFDPAFVYDCSLNFLRENGQKFIEIVNNVMSDFAMRNADELTKGRQTYCPLTESSLPCPRAFKNMIDFMQRNGAPANLSILTLIGEFFILMEKTEIVAPVIQTVYVTKKVRVEGRVVEVKNKKKKTKWTKLQGDEKFRYLMNIARSFCTYIKHGERSHLERRAIASPNIIKRAFLSIIEEVHGRWGKVIEGSTISIGGEEKKNKIITTVESLAADAGRLIRKQGTEDATKWNETLSAALFGMIQRTFLDPEVRTKLNLNPPTDYERMYMELSMSSHFLLAVKRVTLGHGLQGTSRFFHGEITFSRESLGKMNEGTRAWVEEALPLMTDGFYLEASPGMLMGMHNTLSTTVGLVPVNALHHAASMMKVLRSSDDSMSMHAGATEEEVLLSTDIQYFELKKAGIAMSFKKTALYRERYGEFTSWFQDGKLVSQFGPETTTLRPLGRNPYDDTFAVAKGTAVSLLNCASNPFGAEVKLSLGIHNVRSLYRIKRVQDDDIPGAKVRVVADGGDSPYCVSNCHLDESVLKEKLHGQGFEGYFLKIRNPLNPFSRPLEETTYFNRDLGTLTTDFMDIPATIFSYMRRGNRTLGEKGAKSNAQSEEEAQKVVEVINELDYSTALRIPVEGTLCADFCKTNLLLLRGDLQLNDEEQAIFSAALSTLETGTSQRPVVPARDFEFSDDEYGE